MSIHSPHHYAKSYCHIGTHHISSPHLPWEKSRHFSRIGPAYASPCSLGVVYFQHTISIYILLEYITTYWAHWIFVPHVTPSGSLPPLTRTKADCSGSFGEPRRPSTVTCRLSLTCSTPGPARDQARSSLIFEMWITFNILIMQISAL